ncbi:HDOD domain-containing protein [Amphritea sp. 2_MG-2023]|uniref:EAL and HDOD domain-containing protein n=1 Tax=Amphritea TaxID=515417 RepID=UPI001C070CC1|nr:HDOD domain-containing protein [Amphritea sp. 2_MG-2023]MBU2964769.1 HDOD domain-containing protein [Amphritea atlantica]MDO6417166.1 HDOD domain-containing protein [Amphritea sp. 2_MG-2023]
MSIALDEDVLADGSVLLARQPIFNKSQDVQAYSLLYRSDKGTMPLDFSDEQATASVILNNYAVASSGGKTKRLPLFVKLTQSMLLSDMLPNLPHDSVVFELLREDGISKELLNVLRARKEQGYKFALTHYTGDKAQTALLDLMYVVKIDIQRHDDAELKQLVSFCKPYRVHLLADKVESQDDFRRAIGLGFHLYQGYFLCRPVSIKGKNFGSSKILILELLSELNNPAATAESVEQIVINDPALTYKILRLVNSAAFSTPKEIESISHAISLIGMDQVKKWATLFLLSGQSDKPEELTRVMLIRGRMCELLAEMLSYPQTINFFMVGLLSQLDAMMDTDMQVLLNQIPLNDSIKDAILSHINQKGEILTEVQHYERGEWSDMRNLLDKPFYEVAYRHSLQWADQVLASLQEP